MIIAETIRESEALQSQWKVRVRRSQRIPMRDGICLSADLILPEAEGSYPAILEYSPYRKDDATHAKTDWHWYFAQRGFVGVRLDARGTGGSDGAYLDEYAPQEQVDGWDAVEWIARQSWCNGNVGMLGTSYAGFTAVQVAMHRPPHLKAIVPLYATDDRYTDDSHYTQGGNMRMYYDVGCYAGMMAAMNALPPDPELFGERWEEAWKLRLEHLTPYLLNWMKQQVDGSYWRRASLRPDYDRIECAVFLIAGWHDGYPNAMLRMYTNLRCPKKLLIGPWVHSRPNVSVPGPRIDFLNEVARFFSQWLRGEETGIMRDPPVTIYAQAHPSADRSIREIPGYWVNYAEFPPSGVQDVTLYLRENGNLQKEPGSAETSGIDEYVYKPALGTCNRYWSGGALSFYLPEDQRHDEAYSLVYTSSPFDQEILVLGWPKVYLYAGSSAQVATFVAKVSDVAPNGTSTLIVDGSLNGTRRESFSNPSPMIPGESYELCIPMNPTGWVIPSGHRMRLAISSSDFPNLWPTPEPARNFVRRGGGFASRLILPVVPKSDLPPPRFFPPPMLPRLVREHRSPAKQEVVHDHIAGTVALVRHSSVTTTLDNGLGVFRSKQDFRCSTSSLDPTRSSVAGLFQYQIERGDERIYVRAESKIQAAATTFQTSIWLRIRRNGKAYFRRKWASTDERQLL